MATSVPKNAGMPGAVPPLKRRGHPTNTSLLNNLRADDLPIICSLLLRPPTVRQVISALGTWDLETGDN